MSPVVALLALVGVAGAVDPLPESPSGEVPAAAGARAPAEPPATDAPVADALAPGAIEARLRDLEEAGALREILALADSLPAAHPSLPVVGVAAARAALRLHDGADALDRARPWVGHPVVGPEARRILRWFDHRDRRDAPTVALGLTLRGDRAQGARRGVAPGLALGLEGVPAGWFLIRGDLVTGWETADALEVRGPRVGLLAGVSVPLGIQRIDLAAGPTAWLGRSAFWDGSIGGVFPGYRVAAAFTQRPLRPLGWRVELGHDGDFGVYRLVNGRSFGWDARVQLVGWAW
jgi:hypothetical protein